MVKIVHHMVTKYEITMLGKYKEENHCEIIMRIGRGGEKAEGASDGEKRKC